MERIGSGSGVDSRRVQKGGLRCPGRQARAGHWGAAPALPGVHSLNGHTGAAQSPGPTAAGACSSAESVLAGGSICKGTSSSVWARQKQTSPRPLEEGGSRFQAALEPVTGFMLMLALPAPALSLFPRPGRQLNYAPQRASACVPRFPKIIRMASPTSRGHVLPPVPSELYCRKQTKSRHSDAFLLGEICFVLF